MKLFALFLFIFFMGSQAMAQAFKPMTVPLGVAEKIIVRGYKGKLQIVPVRDSELRIEGRKVGGSSYNQWKLQVKNKQNAIEISVRGPSETEDWEKMRTNSDTIPAFEIKMSVPQRPLEVMWKEGSIVAKKWEAPLKVQMTEGDISVENGQGALMAQLIKGRIQVKDHVGSVDLQTYQGQAFLERVQGALSVNNHSSKYQIKDLEGPTDFRNHSGTLVFNTVKGHVHLKNASGVVSLQELDGAFDGTIVKGAVNVEASRLQSFIVKTENAPITLKVPKESGARVKLRSEKGRLLAPPFLRKVRKGRWTELVGRLRGEDQGQIKIISKYGDIMLK